MRDNIMNLEELDIVTRNISMIESRLGYSIPPYIIDAKDLSKGILSLSEVDTIARNIDMINMRREGFFRGLSLLDKVYHGIILLVLSFLVLYGVLYSL